MNLCDRSGKVVVLICNACKKMSRYQTLMSRFPGVAWELVTCPRCSRQMGAGGKVQHAVIREDQES